MLDDHVREVAAAAAREELERQVQPRRWLPLAEAAREFGCSPDALRMRAKRGRVQTRRQGRSVYVRVDGLWDGRRDSGGS
jgi:DNA-directed RNA polymerase specialized sigma24 family protein